jgi:acetyl esterase/lipase
MMRPPSRSIIVPSFACASAARGAALAVCLTLLGVVGLSSIAPAQLPASRERQPLWPTAQETRSAESPVPNPQAPAAAFTLHRPEKPNGTAMVICPGGGYAGLVTGAEGHGIAQWLNQHGITGIVLEYRLPKGNSSLPLADAQRALRLVRSRSAEWNLDPKKIGLIGFSAGGHLASTAGTHFDPGNPSASDPLDRVSCRPDFLVLIYPVVTMGPGAHLGSRKNLLGDNPSDSEILRFSNETQVTPQTPPTFLAHALNDTVVPPAHSAQFFKALQALQVPAHYLELPSGGHGLDRYQGPMWEAWQTQCLTWLRQTGFLPPEQPLR